MLLIPAIDLKEGRCVRLRQGRMDDATIFSDDPLSMAGKWVEQSGRRLHLVDLDGAIEGEPKNAEIIGSIAKQYTDVPIQVGGGIRNLKTIETYLDVGVTYAIIGTQAVKEPAFVAEACKAFPGHIIVGLDAKDGMVATDGWEKVSEVSAIDLAKQFEDAGVSSIVFTDIGRDGMMKGVNVEATAALAEAISIPVVASGGVSSLDDVQKLCEVADTGITGAIVGRAIYEGSIDLKQAQALADQLSG